MAGKPVLLPNSNATYASVAGVPRRLLMCLPVMVRREIAVLLLESLVPLNLDHVTAMPSPALIETLLFLILTVKMYVDWESNWGG